MTGKQLVIIILGAMVGAVLLVLILNLLNIRGNPAIAAGAFGGMAGAFVAYLVSRKR